MQPRLERYSNASKVARNLQRWGVLWGRGQRRHSSASSDDGVDVSTHAQGTAEVTTEDVQSLQHAAGPSAATRCSCSRVPSRVWNLLLCHSGLSPPLEGRPRCGWLWALRDLALVYTSTQVCHTMPVCKRIRWRVQFKVREERRRDIRLHGHCA